MGKLGTIFGLVAAVLAIVAAVLSFLISGKRAQYEARAGKLAETVARMTASLDQNTNSGVGANVTFTAKGEGTEESGSLSWKQYAEDAAAFTQAADSAAGLAAKINQQRDTLAEALGKTAEALAMEQNADPAKFRDLSDEAAFAANVAALEGHVQAVSARDKAMTDALLKASQAVRRPLAEGVFTTRQTTKDADGNEVPGPFPCAAPLDDFTSAVQSVATRCEKYADAIADGIRAVSTFTWSTDPDRLRDERDYRGALTSLENDFAGINERLALYEQAKKQIADQKARIARLEDEVEEAAGELKDSKKELSKAKAEIEKLRKIIGVGPEGEETIDPNLTGTVVQVNEDWNFVVVDVGRTHHVQENLKMLVARDDKLVARLQLSKVFGKVSVAEILPEANIDTVRVGDRVILPKVQDDAE